MRLTSLTDDDRITVDVSVVRHYPRIRQNVIFFLNVIQREIVYVPVFRSSVQNSCKICDVNGNLTISSSAEIDGDKAMV